MLCYAGREQAARETVAACEALGAKAAWPCVRRSKTEAQVKALVDAAVTAIRSRIHILVNNAGVTRDGLLMI